MQIVRCKALGYCHGVKKTIKNADSVLELSRKKGVPSYSIGSLIHNEHVVSYYNKQGLQTISDSDDVKPGVALIRAHGISKAIKERYTDMGFTLIDSTCINITNSIKLIHEALNQKRTVIVVGIKNHSETKTLIGESDEIKLISSIDECKRCTSLYESDTPVTIIVQTTFSQLEFIKIRDELIKYFSDIVFANNLCEVCIERKQLALEMAQSCDATIVVGSTTSSNTKDLAVFLRDKGLRVFFVSDKNSLDANMLTEILSLNRVGICSGTSTPIKVIDELCDYIQSKQR